MMNNERISVFQELITKHSMGGVILSYSRDVFYYTGTAQPAYLCIFPDDYTLFIRSGLDFAKQEAFIDKDKIISERRLEIIKQEIVNKFTSNAIGIELDIISAKNYLELKKCFPDFNFFDVSPIILTQRSKKNSDEIEKLKKACEAIDRGHQAVLNTLVENVTELELAAAVENAHRLAGHEGDIFMRLPDFFMSRGPIASGPNLFKFSGLVYSVTGIGLSSSVSAGPSKREIKHGDLVIIDIPTQVEGYHADQTRTYHLGAVNKPIRKLFDNLKTIEDHLIENIRPGLRCSDIFQMAVNVAHKLNESDAFLSFGNGKQSHLVGHGIGLECSEPPILSKYNHDEIPEESVIVIEMHFLKEGVGVVKMENMIHITHRRTTILSISPREIFEIDT